MLSSTEATPSPAPGSAPKRYVPPQKRKYLEEQERIKTMGPATQPTGSHGFIESVDRAPFAAANFDSGSFRGPMPGGGFGGPAPGPSRQVPDRWKQLDSNDHGRFDYHGGRNHQRVPVSSTGTGWDVRDGRLWKPENPADVFHNEGAEKSVGINFGSYDNIPVELSGKGHEEIEPLTSFKETRGVHQLLHENIVRVEYERPTPVQRNSIPVILSGRDLMACAQTGSGKTAAFLFPIITRMLKTGPPRSAPMNNRTKATAFPVGLVLSPTRELAVQIFKESRKFAFGTGIKTVVVYGGSEVKGQIISLRNGCDICVATPGRLSEFTQRGIVALDAIKYLVLDEADRMLDMGFAPQIYGIVEESSMPTSADGRQTVMFSATFPTQIQSLAAQFLSNYIFLTVGRVGSTSENITQSFVYALEASKPKKLLSVLGENKGGLMLVFVETKKKADLIETFLTDSGLPAVSLHGDKSQDERERALQYFRTGRRPILVATDVAARGLDIHNISHVINCDLPARIEDYVHRIGRTGRAGNRGKATSFVNESNKAVLRDLLGLLDEAQQEVPPWFFDMVKSCTSAFRTFGSSTGHGKPNTMSRSASRQGFGSRDYRGDTKHAFGATPTKSFSRPVMSNSVSRADEEEDGW